MNLSLKAQEFFFEASEVESWLNERSDVLSSTDYGRDRDAATKLLTKHKALELELDTYNGIVTEMGHNANAMVTAKHPDSKAILTKHQLLAQQLRSLQRIATVRQQRLMESMYRHEYFLESAELEQWIKEQEISAASEDYGQDYEHLLVSTLIIKSCITYMTLNNFNKIIFLSYRYYKLNSMILNIELKLDLNDLINVKN